MFQKFYGNAFLAIVVLATVPNVAQRSMGVDFTFSGANIYSTCQQFQADVIDPTVFPAFQAAFLSSQMYLSSLTVLPQAPSTTLFVATFADESFSLPKLQTCLGTFFNFSVPVIAQLSGPVISLNDADRSQLVSFGFSSIAQDEATTVFLNCIKDASCNSYILSQLMNVGLRATSITTGKATSASQSPEVNWIQQHPEVIIGTIAGFLLIVLVVVVYVVQQRAKRHEKLRRTMEAMMEGQQTSLSDLERHPSASKRVAGDTVANENTTSSGS